MACQRGLHGGEFFGGNIPRVVPAILPVLEFVIRPGGGRPVLEGVRRELAPFHDGNRGDLLENEFFAGWFHNVPSILDTISQNTSRNLESREFCLTPYLNLVTGITLDRRGSGKRPGGGFP